MSFVTARICTGLSGPATSHNLLLLARPRSVFVRTFGIAAPAGILNVKSGRNTHDCRVVVVTSGKGGVGKTTTAASFAYGLASRGHRTCVIDFDIGLRNLDLHLGCERRVIFDFVNVINKECSLNQALIKDKRLGNLFVLAASQTRDKTALTEDGVGRVLDELRPNFDYIVCDSPAGIESGARHAMYFADDAVICTNPELSSCRDSDKMIGFISSKSLRAIQDRDPVKQSLLILRYDVLRVQEMDSLTVEDITEMLGIPLLGVIPESKRVLSSSNVGQPVIMAKGCDVAEAYEDMVGRFLGEQIDMRFITPKQRLNEINSSDHKNLFLFWVKPESVRQNLPEGWLLGRQ